VSGPVCAEFGSAVQFASRGAPGEVRGPRQSASEAEQFLQPILRVKHGILPALFALLLALPAGGTRRVENYPKVLAYSWAIGLLPEATRDTLSWYDVLVCADRPEVLSSLRQKNPGLRFLWTFSPQFVTLPAGENPWWIADTLWSVSRLFQFYAEKNDWYLRDTAGRPIESGPHRVVNWTRHCPPGVYGSSRGLRAAEWIASVALPAIALSGRYWEPWSWDSRSAYNGVMFETLVDCLGSYGWQPYANADPDRDGAPDGVYSVCTDGGWQDPLSLLFREENEIFYSRLRDRFPESFAFLMNENHQFIGPWWSTRLSGMKLENWMRPSNPSWFTWWDQFYGLTPPWEPGSNWGAGYAWTEASFDNGAEDHQRGWDRSFIQAWIEPGRSAQENERQMRWGLGTAMLGEGYFCYTADQRMPEWPGEFDYDFGQPIGDFQRELPGGADTLYVRQFTRGMVEVNPNDASLGGVGPRDSRFTFWLPVEDLAAAALGPRSIRATWTAPDGERNEADSFELRYATQPITLENWDAAAPYRGNPIPASPGAAIAAEIDGLDDGRTYFLAVRTRTRGRLEPVLSNLTKVATPAEVDRVPPGQVQGLTAYGGSQDWIDLEWIAPGDDGTEGRAAAYLLRHLAGEMIETQSDWTRATPASGLPAPDVAGARQSFRLSGLAAGTAYGVAIRAVDEAGNLSPLPARFLVATSPPPPVDRTPPAAILDLAAAGPAPGLLLLGWTAPGDDGTAGRADRYEIRLADGREILTEADWLEATEVGDPPAPADPGAAQACSLASLLPGMQYGVALRAYDEAGNLGALSNPVLARAGPSAPPPEIDTTPPGVLSALLAASVSDTHAVLQWTATGDDGSAGRAARYEARILEGEAIESEEAWARAGVPDRLRFPAPDSSGALQQGEIGALRPASEYGIALRAVDEAGNIGPLGAALLLQTAFTERPDTIPPDPILDARAARVDSASVTLLWTVPSDRGKRAAIVRYHLRIASTSLADERIWEEGEAYAPLPYPAESGTADSVAVARLAPSTSYAFVLRCEDEAGNLSLPSNIVRATTSTPALPPSPPAAISDFVLVASWSDSARLAWTAPGDEGESGRASRYEVRLRTDAPIETEDDWLLAEVVEQPPPPVPAPPGTREEWTLRGLQEARGYALAVRAVDDSAQMGGLSNPLRWTTPPSASVTAFPILDLTSPAQGEDWCDLRWSAPETDPPGGAIRGYRLGILAGAQVIATEADWSHAEIRTEGLPDPASPGSEATARIGALRPSSIYSMAVRSEIAPAALSPIGSGILVTTAPAEEGDPEGLDPPPAPIADLAASRVGPDWVDLVWTAVGEDSLDGIAEAYVLGRRIEAPLLSHEDWNAAAVSTEGLPRPALPGRQQAHRVTGLAAGREHAIALRAVDAAGRISPLSTGIRVRTFPHTPVPPAAAESLRVFVLGQGRARIDWLHEPADGDTLPPASCLLAVAVAPITAESWPALAKIAVTPRAGSDRQEAEVSGLLAGTEYWIAVRVRSAEGLFSALSDPISFTTSGGDLSPPDPPDGLRIEQGETNGMVRLSWRPSPAPDLAGYWIYGQLPEENWGRLIDSPLPPETTTALVPEGCAAYALSAIDLAGNEGSLSSPVAPPARASLVVRGPYPHPVEDRCRLEIETPSGDAAARLLIRVYDLHGTEVRTLFDDAAAGSAALSVPWDRRDDDGRTVAPGFYVIVTSLGERKSHKRIFVSP